MPCDEWAMAYHDRRDLNAHTVYGEEKEEDEVVNLSCDHRAVVSNNSCELQTHREALRRKCEGGDIFPSDNEGKDQEESYDITRGRDNVLQFTCKKCDESCASQRAILQHIMVKHGTENGEIFYHST